MRAALALALAACALAPAHARGELRLHDAGGCGVHAPAPEDPGLRWDYWWSGGCAAGLATGPGYLLQFMKGGGFGDVYAARMAQGRMEGETQVYGPLFLGVEWNVRVARPGPGEGAIESETAQAGRVARFALPAALQQALNRFAREAGHPQMPALPEPPAPVGCPAFVDEDGRPNAERRGTDIAAYIREHGGRDAARRDALMQALDANAARDLAAPGQREARRLLALAAAVSGCAVALGW